MTDDLIEKRRYSSEDQARRAKTMRPHSSLGYEEINELFMAWGIIGKSRPIGPKPTYYMRSPLNRLAIIDPGSGRGR
jgi:hypothetical protein